MRLVRFLFCYVLLSVFGVVLALFLAQNWGTTLVSFFGLTYSIHLAVVLAGSATFGALATLLLLLPGRLAAMVHRWNLERDLGQWEQDLWKLQEQHGRLLNRHERLLEAHERVLQAHHRLVGEHSQVTLERDQIRTQLAQVAQVAAARGPAAHQAARVPSMPRVVVTSPFSPGGRTTTPAASSPHAHDTRGRQASTSSPRWAVPCPPGRSGPAPAARVSGASFERSAADRVADRVAADAGEFPPAALATPAASQSVAVERPLESAPVVGPLPAVGEPTALRAAPRTVPLLSPERVAAGVPPAGLAGPALAASQVISLRSLRRAADQTIAFVIPQLAKLRSWLRTTFAAMVAPFAARRVLLEARLAQLKRSILQGMLPLESDASRTSSAPIELPGGDDRRT